MLDRLERLGDRLLGLVVPQTTAAANHCYYVYRCGGSCSAPYVLWRYKLHCCSGTSECSVAARTCSCYQG